MPAAQGLVRLKTKTNDTVPQFSQVPQFQAESRYCETVRRLVVSDHRVEHLPYYLDEFVFRFNRRASNHRGCSFLGFSRIPCYAGTFLTRILSNMSEAQNR